jgi:hypothetical protein
MVGTGDKAYVGPSGTFTNSASFGGDIVGRFLGPLEADPHLVVMRGQGFSRQFVDPETKAIVTENDPADRTLVLSDGYIKIRIHDITSQ